MTGLRPNGGLGTYRFENKIIICTFAPAKDDFRNLIW